MLTRESGGGSGGFSFPGGKEEGVACTQVPGWLRAPLGEGRQMT